MPAPRDENRVPAVQATSVTGTALSPTASAEDSSQVGLHIKSVLSSSLRVGQKKVAVTGTAVALVATSVPVSNGVIITARSTNAKPVSIGNSDVNNTQDGTGNGYMLEAGASVSFAVSNLNLVYINGDANDYVSFAGS